MWGNRFSRINDSVNHNTDTTFLEFQGKEGNLQRHAQNFVRESSQAAKQRF